VPLRSDQVIPVSKAVDEKEQWEKGPNLEEKKGSQIINGFGAASTAINYDFGRLERYCFCRIRNFAILDQP
jgi:hypothetical protein